MVDSRSSLVDALSRRLQDTSASGWANIQTPVREGFQAVEATTKALADQLAASREDVVRLEARLAGMEELVRSRLPGVGRPIVYVGLGCAAIIFRVVYHMI